MQDTAPSRAEMLVCELARKIDAFVIPEEKRVTAVPGQMLVRRTNVTQPMCTTYEPHFALIAQGKKRVELGSSTFIYDEAKFLLTSLDLPILGQVIEASESRPFLGLSLKIEMPLVRECLSMDDVSVPASPPSGPALTVAETTAEILDACCRLIDLLQSPCDIPFLSPLIQREIIYRILTSPEGARLRAIATHGDQSHRTAKAISWLRTNYSKPLRIEELARMAGMGVSTLHSHFRAMTSMSPLQYQKHLRLQSARGLMLSGAHDAATAGFEARWLPHPHPSRRRAIGDDDPLRRRDL